MIINDYFFEANPELAKNIGFFSENSMTLEFLIVLNLRVKVVFSKSIYFFKSVKRLNISTKKSLYIKFLVMMNLNINKSFS